MNTQIESVTLADIDRLTRAYTKEHRVLAERVEALQINIDELTRSRRPGIIAAANRAKDAKAALAAAIERAPHLFEKPRTLTIDGCKVGLEKGKGKIVVAKGDEAKVIARIKKIFDEETAARLINTKETIAKTELGKLPAADLKRLGLEVADAGDQVVIKMTDAQIQKLVDAFLAETRDVEDDA